MRLDWWTRLPKSTSDVITSYCITGVVRLEVPERPERQEPSLGEPNLRIRFAGIFYDDDDCEIRDNNLGEEKKKRGKGTRYPRRKN